MNKSTLALIFLVFLRKILLPRVIFRKFKCCPLFQESIPRQCSTVAKPSNRDSTPFCCVCVCCCTNCPREHLPLFPINEREFPSRDAAFPERKIPRRRKYARRESGNDSGASAAEDQWWYAIYARSVIPCTSRNACIRCCTRTVIDSALFNRTGSQ